MKHISLIGIVSGIAVSILGSVAIAEDTPFRPEPGKFPPLEKAHVYRGELVFVDHANRRGSIRVQGEGTYFRNPPHPFAMLPYGMVCYHAAPADMRDLPLGTVLHVRGYLPPDPKTSAVPVLPVNAKDKDHGYLGKGITPAENHVLLLEDEPSHCLREGKVWKLEELDITNNAGTIIASRQSKQGETEKADEETLTFDGATRIWRGRESLLVEDLVAEDIWPKSGKKSLEGQAVQLGISWKPNAEFTQFHISDIWLDDTAMQLAVRKQTEIHKAFIRSRWMPARVEAVEYGKFGNATVSVTLFGGMDDSLYADFKKNVPALMNGAENTLKHTAGVHGPAHMASRGRILDVIKTDEVVPLGNSGIQVRFKTDLIIEGIRPGRVVRVRPDSWPKVKLPREEYLEPLFGTPQKRFPTSEIFPKY